MKGRAAIFAAFLGAVAIITWRDFTDRDPDWPLPVPPPYRYVGAAVAFGMLSLVAEFVNEKVPAVLAMGLLVGLGFQTAQQGKRTYQPDNGGALVGRGKPKNRQGMQ
jgi:hypothetical protein